MEPLSFGETVRAPDVRTLYDMRDVVADRMWLETAEDFDLYYMYRELARNEEELGLMREFGLRYDITVIPPARLGKEYVKTKGHYHPRAPNFDVSYPEIYQVLEGEAVYLLQKMGRGGKVADVVVVEAGQGDIVVVPPDYGHITVNRSNKVLKMANWVCVDFSSLYEPVRQFGGGAYFLLEDGFVRNPAYCFVPELRLLEPERAELFGLSKGEDMYSLIEDLQVLRFLKEPQTFSGLFAVEV
ncbi:glucose-6-phosphate isomerase family protein [Methanosarcina sp. 1.H.A.2.2]|uniref:glucose-6-phosphate isomerase family protein n=1 Tax=Methanosarcina sp. 1.H.A.2.2 TaxID=1483601 RepID=UPI000620EF44|nr:glucose-6-phosphate isomerase family protein [Methanosarcina sp. 1.H.A.2.2]KKH49576.1 glucose-6-phosphate isomerase [Methanosarcina sp. 1.H.A.2.2]